ncbi:8-oxo-dGTP diphosphatase MutT [Opitutaceae bacterium]
MSKPSPIIPVVCALIERGDRVLIARRPAHKHLGNKWEFPGGKVEPGETAAAAILREIREELGCTIAITRPIPPFVHDYGTVVIEMIPFVVRLTPDSGEPAVTEHSELAWARLDELTRYDLAPADLPAIASYRAGLASNRSRPS